MRNNKENSDPCGGGDGRPPVRYLQCPAGVTVRLLKKFLIGKFDINAKQYHIDILYKSVPLPDDYKLLDIAYIYSWKQSKPMRIFYRVMDIKYAVHRFDYFRPSSVKKPLSQISKTKPPAAVKKDEQAPPANALLKEHPSKAGSVVGNISEASKVEKPSSEVTAEVTGKLKDSTSVTVLQVNSEINKTVKQLNKIKKAQEKAQKKADKLSQKMLSEKKKLSEKNKPIRKVGGKSDEKLVIKSDKEKKSVEVIKNGNKTSVKTTNGIHLTNGDSKDNEELKTDKRNDRLREDSECEKSKFLNGFQLIPIRELEQRKMEIITARAACKTSPVSTSKTKNSPKKSSPKNTSPKFSASPTPPAIPALPKTKSPSPQKNTTNNNTTTATSAVTHNNKKPSMKEENKLKTGMKRPYSMANRTIAMNNKKAKLEKAEQDKLLRLEREKLQKQKIENIILQQREKHEHNVETPKSTKVNAKAALATLPSPPNNRLVAVTSDKRKTPNLTTVPVDKRTNLPSNPTSAPPTPTLKSLLFDNCNLNIPSSLSITLTESSGDKDASGVCAPNSEATSKRQSPPVNMYIEIFKIPDESDKRQDKKPPPALPQVQNITPSVTATPIGPAPLTKVVTSLPLPSSKPNFVVHTTGIQSLGRKTSTPLNSPPVAGSSPSTATLTPAPAVAPPPPSFKTSGVTSETNKPKKILPKPVAGLSTTPFIPKLAESPKATTGFQKMFEEAIKRKEAMKVQQQITLPPAVKPKPAKEQNHASSTAALKSATTTTPLRVSTPAPPPTPPTTMDKYNAALQTALDLSTPNSSGVKRPLSPTTSYVPSKRTTPIPIQPKKSPPQSAEPRLTSPLPNLPLPEKLNNSLALLNPTTNGSTAVATTTAAAFSLANSNINTIASLLNPNVLQTEFNLKNLAQLRHMMMVRQLEFRKHLMKNNGGNGGGTAVAAAAATGMLSNGGGDTLLEFENYMKRLQQQAQAAATKQ